VVCVADTDAEAEKLYAPHVSYFYNRCLHVYPGFADAPGYRTIKTIQTGALSQFTQSGRDYPNMSWKDLTEGRYVVAGSPETVRQQMEELIKTLRVGNVFCLLHLGNMPDEKVRYSSRLFAEKVIPRLRNLWPDWDNHDDRFWIHPMPERLAMRAAAE
jgi:alkanesulfonate monooxygenase SsuD/methylene tetrahydromethanopterin reductase-like flavin-dependent oxidoreductase (luciferase family)